MEEELRALKINRTPGKRGDGKVWKLVSLLLLLALAALAALYFWPVEEATPVQADADPIRAESRVPTAADRNEVLIASGYVVPHHRISLGSKVMGRVAWMGVEKGDRVRQGQLLVKLEDREFRAQLEQAQAAFDAAEAYHQELQSGARPEEIERARAELQRAETESAHARLEYQRLQSLLDDDVVSTQEVDNAESRWKMTEASVRVAEKNLRLLELGPRAEQIAQARAEMERARGAVRYAQTMLDATEIRAPVDGTILARIAEVGEMITTSFAGEAGAKSAVVSLADLNDLMVELDISQSDFKRISPDQDCQMSPEAFPDRQYPCRIYEISPEANRQRATIQVKVQVLDPDEFLRPEMSARVTFLRKEEVENEPAPD